MAVLLTDAVIERLVAEPKSLPADYRQRVKVKPKRGHKESELDVKGAEGSEFRLILRQASANPLDFSVILAYLVPQTNRVFRLCRYNGRHGEHTNRLEGQTFYDLHIHKATERYQESGFDEDAFAEPTGRYSDLDGAVECILAECGFVLPPDSQRRLF
jgi:hypothetical protein